MDTFVCIQFYIYSLYYNLFTFFASFMKQLAAFVVSQTGTAIPRHNIIKIIKQTPKFTNLTELIMKLLEKFYFSQK